MLVRCAIVGRGVCVLLSFFFVLCANPPSHIFGVRSGILFPWESNTPQTQLSAALISIMAAKGPDYDSWSLEDLRAEARKRSLLFVRKDGVKTLASKLRMHDRLMRSESPAAAAKELDFSATEDKTELLNELSFEQEMKLQERELAVLELRRKIMQDERDAEMEKRKFERELERERREFERQKAREEEERSIREEERLRSLRQENKEFTIRDVNRQQSAVKKPKFIKIREMRESEDIDDYFRIFEMTAKAQSLPGAEWVGNLVPKLTEKAKSIYLDIPEPAS